MQPLNNIPSDQISFIEREEILWNASRQYMQGKIDVVQLDNIEKQFRKSAYDLKTGETILRQENLQLLVEIASKEIELEHLKQILRDRKESFSLRVAALHLISIILFSIGINLATIPGTLSIAGWLMVVLASLVEIVFFIRST